MCTPGRPAALAARNFNRPAVRGPWRGARIYSGLAAQVDGKPGRRVRCRRLEQPGGGLAVQVGGKGAGVRAPCAGRRGPGGRAGRARDGWRLWPLPQRVRGALAAWRHAGHRARSDRRVRGGGAGGAAHVCASCPHRV